MALTTVRITDGICPVFSSGGSRRAHNLHFSHLKSTQRLTSVAAAGRRRYRAKVTATVNPYSNTEAARPEERKSLRDFLSEAENFYTSDGGDGGPPRWFSPLQFTRVNNFMLQPLSSLLETLPDEVPSLIEDNFGFREGYPFSAMLESMLKETVAQMGGGLLGDLFEASANLPTLIRIFPKDTLLWKLQLLKSASASAKSHMYTVKAQTLILLSGRDQWLPNNGDIERLRFALPKCEVREFYNNGQFLFLVRCSL
ncbi:hypothetical protein Bca52824_046452 [Brassica carinata]|uniref:Uncharacterized protein n=1 Tax=Brassica carinata TaxID=52824 RepID=A0A8X7RH72_BRACI|nr:hypothetical protein Bca52824_046452 [Brassica carinata]